MITFLIMIMMLQDISTKLDFALGFQKYIICEVLSKKLSSRTSLYFNDIPGTLRTFLIMITFLIVIMMLVDNTIELYNA